MKIHVVRETPCHEVENNNQGQGDQMNMNNKVGVGAKGGDVSKLIGQLTDKAVEGINIQTAESWLKIGEQVLSFVNSMTAQFGGKNDWYAELANHPSSLHECTMLRTYARGWEIWQKLSDETRGAMSKEGIKVTHVAQVLGKGYNQEDREIHLKHAAEEGLSVSQFKAYLKAKEMKAVFVDDGESGLIPALVSPKLQFPAPVLASKDSSEEVIPIDWSQCAADLQKSLSKTYSTLVSLKEKIGGREMPTDISQAINNLVRFAVTQGIVSKEDIREFMDIKAARMEFLKASGTQDQQVSGSASV